jgi:hypothetical protein
VGAVDGVHPFLQNITRMCSGDGVRMKLSWRIFANSVQRPDVPIRYEVMTVAGITYLDKEALTLRGLCTLCGEEIVIFR